jgi:TRAP-type C4-dicarboxylate transport system substrate-binding protein
MTRLRSFAVVLVGGAVARGGWALARPMPVDKAGAVEEPVVLTLGTGESNSNPMVPVFEAFADAVAARTDGRVTVEIVYGAHDGATDFEQAVIDRVRAGTLDLGVTATRGWDDEVPALGALQTPFLIDSYPLLDKVLRSPTAERLLGSLDARGFTGIGLYPAQLRHPLGIRRPIVSAADYAGLGIRVPVSVVSDGLMHAFGAEPLHVTGEAISDGVANGDIEAVDTSVGNAAMWPLSSTLTANVIYYPLVGLFFADSFRFGELDLEAQAALRGAGADATAFALGSDLESADLDAFCRSGYSLAMASGAELRDLQARSRAVENALRAYAAAAAAIDDIRATKAQLGAPPSVPSCPSPVSP